jgi:pimeloyl-ACP methyl ester carboxylesterase
MTDAARNIVLVHGAFADETSWHQVAARLREKKFNVTLVANPLTSLEHDVAATRRTLAEQDGKVVLVGHSWGGVVIGEAGNDPKVIALVYVAAFGLAEGESVQAVTGEGMPSAGLMAIRPDDNGFLTIDPDAYPSVFAGDVPLETAIEMANRQLPINAACFGIQASSPAWKVKPSYYAISSKDLMLTPELQAMFAARMMAKTITIEASHASPESQADAIVALIEEAAVAA